MKKYMNDEYNWNGSENNIKKLNLESLGRKWILKILNYCLGDRWITDVDTTLEYVGLDVGLSKREEKIV